MDNTVSRMLLLLKRIQYSKIQIYSIILNSDIKDETCFIYGLKKPGQQDNEIVMRMVNGPNSFNCVKHI